MNLEVQVLMKDTYQMVANYRGNQIELTRASDGFTHIEVTSQRGALLYEGLAEYSDFGKALDEALIKSDLVQPRQAGMVQVKGLSLVKG